MAATGPEVSPGNVFSLYESALCSFLLIHTHLHFSVPFDT